MNNRAKIYDRALSVLAVCVLIIVMLAVPMFALFSVSGHVKLAYWAELLQVVMYFALWVVTTLGLFCTVIMLLHKPEKPGSRR